MVGRSGSVQMASLETKPKELPEDFEIFVQAEFLVAGHHRDLFAHSLSNNLAVERVRVVWRKMEKIERMMRRVGQYAKAWRVVSMGRVFLRPGGTETLPAHPRESFLRVV